MSFNQTLADEAFATLGLSAPSPAEVDALGSLDFVQAQMTIGQLPEVQTQVIPIVQMFDAALGHMPLPQTLASMVSSHMSEASLASAIVSSQAFANVNNGGVLLDPNAPVSEDLVDAMFIRNLGHPPSVATMAGFEGLTNEQAFLAFATSDTFAHVIGSAVSSYIFEAVELATGIVSPGPGAGPGAL